MKYRPSFYILKDRIPVVCPDSVAWAEWFEKADRRVVWTQIGLFKVSTVFLGIDHNFIGDGVPLLFETMVFDADNNGGECKRSATWEEALVQHAEMCRRTGLRMPV